MNGHSAPFPRPQGLAGRTGLVRGPEPETDLRENTNSGGQVIAVRPAPRGAVGGGSGGLTKRSSVNVAGCRRRVYATILSLPNGIGGAAAPASEKKLSADRTAVVPT